MFPLKKKSSGKVEASSRGRANTGAANNSYSDCESESSADEASGTTEGTTTPAESSSKASKWDPKANHGRYGFNDYVGCEIHGLYCDGLKAGAPCPACFSMGATGKLYTLPPGKLIRLEGHPAIIGRRYEIEKFRCTLCGEVYQAKVPESIANAPKYAPSVKSRIAVSRYGMGLPHKRQEQFQGYQGIPLADYSTKPRSSADILSYLPITLRL